jgi:hypothetical protein
MIGSFFYRRHDDLSSRLRAILFGERPHLGRKAEYHILGSAELLDHQARAQGPQAGDGGLHH